MVITAQELVKRLKESGILENSGQSRFDFLGVSNTLTDKSAVGYIFQNWLLAWMNQSGIEAASPENTQEFPDFYMSPLSTTKDLLEIKVFDYDGDANFDIANFESYCDSLLSDSYRLDADYLIFSYTLREGIFKVNNIFLKKIWEITCPGERYAIRFQIKRDVIYNIRPASIFRNPSGKSKFKIFDSRKSFVEALYSVLMKYPKTSLASSDWLVKVKENYLSHTGNTL